MVLAPSGLVPRSARGEDEGRGRTAAGSSGQPAPCLLTDTTGTPCHWPSTRHRSLEAFAVGLRETSAA